MNATCPDHNFMAAIHIFVESCYLQLCNDLSHYFIFTVSNYLFFKLFVYLYMRYNLSHCFMFTVSDARQLDNLFGFFGVLNSVICNCVIIYLVDFWSLRVSGNDPIIDL